MLGSQLLSQTKKEELASEAKVIAIYPTTNTVPENILRFYITFSQPMRQGDFLQYIHLYDDDNKVVNNVFLDNYYEIWNNDFTEITLILDPGRVKTGLTANEAMGRGLKKGGNYTLIIDPSWQTIEGNHLDKSYAKSFTVLAEDRDALSIDNWKIEPPKSGSLNPLIITFPKPIDHINAQNYITVINNKGKLIQGQIQLKEQETKWLFIPNKRWEKAPYFIQINSRIEDLAGNNLNGSFDHLTGSLKNQQEGKPETITLNID
jgi:hypothetical protein